MKKYEQEVLDTFDTIVKNNNRIGILISGGIDSGLALFLLLKTITDNGLERQVHACTVTKTPDAVENAVRIIKIISAGFDIPVHHHVVDSEYNDDQHTMHTTSAFKWLMINDIADIVISATNAIVPHQLLPDRPNPSRVVNTSKYMIRPFINYTKDTTVGLAISFNLIELLANSHSCIKQSWSACGSCYWCLERKWGFAMNNYKDPSNELLQ